MDASGDSSSDALTMAQLEGFELEEEEHGALELVQLAKVLDSQGHIEEAEDLFQSALDRFGRQGGTLQRGSIASDVQGDRVMVSSLFNFSTCTHAHSSLLFFSSSFFFDLGFLGCWTSRTKHQTERLRSTQPYVIFFASRPNLTFAIILLACCTLLLVLLLLSSCRCLLLF